jgi:hypothetical protein
VQDGERARIGRPMGTLRQQAGIVVAVVAVDDALA